MTDFPTRLRELAKAAAEPYGPDVGQFAGNIPDEPYWNYRRAEDALYKMGFRKSAEGRTLVLAFADAVEALEDSSTCPESVCNEYPLEKRCTACRDREATRYQVRAAVAKIEEGMDVRE